MQLFQKNSRSHLPETVVDSEDSPEPVDSRSSSDNEVELFYNCSCAYPFIVVSGFKSVDFYR